MQKRRLGRGLGALIREAEEGIASEGVRSEILKVPVTALRANPLQPRRGIDPAGVEELAQSLREKGMLQPILVRSSGEAYEVVVGERRWRAAVAAGWTEVPCIEVDLTDREMLEYALVENLQREELDPIEEATAYQMLAERFGETHEEIAVRVGRERTSVVNAIRLLRLPAEVQALLRTGSITAGHARALLAIEDPVEQLRLAVRVAEEGLSVREAEGWGRQARTRVKGPGAARGALDARVVAGEEELQRLLGTRVRIRPGRSGKGQIEIAFYSLDDLARLLDLLRVHL